MAENIVYFSNVNIVRSVEQVLKFRKVVIGLYIHIFSINFSVNYYNPQKY